LSLAYGWTTEQIAEMTLAQIVAYWLSTPDPGQRVDASPSEARAIGAHIKARRKRWMESVSERL
jgi:hypothetical protein